MKKTILLPYLALSMCTNAAIITWGSVQDITGDTAEIVDIGEYSGINTVSILNLSQYTDSTISDVTASGSDVTTTTGAFTSSDYDTALNSFDYDFSDLLSSGLVSGETYYIQFFYMDQRNDAYNSRSMIVDDGNGNDATMSSDGQYVIGSFVADGSSQTLNINGSVSGPHLNMIVFATTSTQAPGVGTDNNPGTTIPEPTSISLIALGAISLLTRRSR